MSSPIGGGSPMGPINPNFAGKALPTPKPPPPTDLNMFEQQIKTFETNGEFNDMAQYISDNAAFVEHYMPEDQMDQDLQTIKDYAASPVTPMPSNVADAIHDFKTLEPHTK